MAHYNRGTPPAMFPIMFMLPESVPAYLPPTSMHALQQQATPDQG